MRLISKGRSALIAFGVFGVTMVGMGGCGPVIAFGPADCAANPSYPEAPCGSLASTIKSLKPGDTLQLAPGTYDTGYMRINDVRGTAASPITITAKDPTQKPVLLGWVAMWGADYVTLDNLRLQANYTLTDHGGPGGALSMMCGVGWRIQNSDLSGTDHTLGGWNLLIGGTRTVPPAAPSASDCPGEPSNFTVTQNVFHHPRITDCSTSDAPNQHISATFAGDSGTSGMISRNVFAGAHCGAGIRLGTGSTARPEGAWNVTIQYNTFYDDARAITTQNDIHGLVINRNLTDKISYPHSINPSIPVALGSLPAETPANTISHTYAANNLNPNGLVWGPVRDDKIGVLVDACDNAFRAGGDPMWNSTDPLVANAFTPANPTAAAYGRYGTGALTCP